MFGASLNPDLLLRYDDNTRYINTTRGSSLKTTDAPVGNYGNSSSSSSRYRGKAVGQSTQHRHRHRHQRYLHISDGVDAAVKNSSTTRLTASSHPPSPVTSSSSSSSVSSPPLTLYDKIMNRNSSSVPGDNNLSSRLYGESDHKITLSPSSPYNNINATLPFSHTPNTYNATNVALTHTNKAGTNSRLSTQIMSDQPSDSYREINAHSSNIPKVKQSSFSSSPLPNYTYNDINSINPSTKDHSNYQQYDLVPFNADRHSASPHFDAEFFPESLSPLDTVKNNRTSSPDPFSSIPWGATPDRLAPSFPPHRFPSNSHTNGSTAFQTLYNNTLPNVIFDRLYHPDTLSSTSTTAAAANLTWTPSGFSDFLGGEFTNTNNTSLVPPSQEATGDLYTWSILMLAPLVVFGVAGNTLVILAISLEKRLQNVTNYFLLSLAVTDLLVSLIVMPLSIINVFTGRWLFGLILCDLFVTSDVLMCTSSILHLCTISLERYIGIRYPLWVKNKSKRVVLLKIVLVWTIALAITSPITVLGVVREENVLVDGECVLSNEHFIIYGSIFAFFIPLTIMVLMYALTVRMLNAQARLCQGRRADDGAEQPMIRRSTSRKNYRGRRHFYGGGVCGGRRRESNRESTRSYYGTQMQEGEPSEESADATSSTAMMMMIMANSALPPSSSPLSSPSKAALRTSDKCNHLPVNRHNTLPMCHHRLRNQQNQQINNCQNGRSSNLISSRPHGTGFFDTGHNGCGLSGSKNNNNNNFNSNSTDHTDCGSRLHHGGYNPGSTPVNSTCRRHEHAGEHSHCNGHHRPGDISPDPRSSSSTPSSSPPSSTTNHPSINRQSKQHEPARLRELVRKHHVAVKAANILLMKREGQGETCSHLFTRHGGGSADSGSFDIGSMRQRGYLNKSGTPTPSFSNYASVRRDNSVRTEQKASKVLGVVFMIFVICWAPFFTVNILTALCSTCRFEKTLVTAFVWLGYVSSTLNPIIYTIFNNIFRNTFIKLLCCRYRLLHRARRSSHMTGLRKGLLTCSAFCPAPVTAATNASGSSGMKGESNC